MSNPERLQALPQVPREEVGPLFAEPWQAFGLAVKLSEQGHFTWKEWADALANELKAATSRKEPDDGSHYYDHWLAALEHLASHGQGFGRFGFAARAKESLGRGLPANPPTVSRSR